MSFWYEYISFNGWYYGTSKIQFRNDDIFILTPKGISNLLPIDRKESLIIFLDIDENIRKERLFKRGDVDKVERRLKADEEDFKNFTNFIIIFTFFY